MKTPRLYIGALAVFCIAALVIGSAGAAAMMQKGTGRDPMTGQADGDRMLPMLDTLTTQGYDVSAILAAVDSGDYTTAHTLMQEFRNANPNAFPTRGDRTGRGPITGHADGERMLRMLDTQTAQGYDVSAIRSAVESGDYETARTLMQEFRTAYPDSFPACGERAGRDHPGVRGRLQNNW